MSLLKPYIGHGGHPFDGAVLILAHTARQAKPMAYDALGDFLIVQDYIDTRVRRLHDLGVLAYANQELLEEGVPHVIASLTVCKSCEYWGTGCNEDGICDDCGEPTGFSDEFIKLIKKYRTKE